MNKTAWTLGAAALLSALAGHLFGYHAARAIDESARFLSGVRAQVVEGMAADRVREDLPTTLAPTRREFLDRLGALSKIDLFATLDDADVEPKVKRALLEVGLESHRDLLPAELSFGERQRCAIARAIVASRTGEPIERTAQLAGGVDHKDAIARLQAAVAQIPNVMQQPAPEVSLLDINLLGTVIAVRPYTNNAHYWQVYFDTNEAIVRTCKEAGWPAPTPTTITRLVNA